jgi:hypothetical protein
MTMHPADPWRDELEAQALREIFWQLDQEEEAPEFETEEIDEELLEAYLHTLMRDD